jgi:hypothetical protein
MKNKKGQPICGYTINGPHVARNVVMWIKQCGHIVKEEGQRCWQHGGAA